MYKLVALDMDGTLLNNRKEITPRTKQALQLAREKGIKIVLASGRPLDGMTRYLKELGISGEQEFVLYCNGSMVKELGSDEVIHQQILSGRDAKSVFQLAEKLGLDCHAFSSEYGVITPKHNPYTEIETRINQIPVREMNFTELDDEHPIVKVLIVASEDAITAAMKHIPSEFRERYNIVRSATHFLEFLHLKSSKGYGVEAIARSLDIKPEQIVAMGDAENDNHMIEYAGLGVAMGNAMDNTKQLANHITLTNEEEGVAEVFEKMILTVE